ncbi:MAG TPA: hypothetical protein DCS93_00685 [Microscillaceae bacterium]|nr:hypothetical protein [Microscillaceae bacterium]
MVLSSIKNHFLLINRGLHFRKFFSTFFTFVALLITDYSLNDVKAMKKILFFSYFLSLVAQTAFSQYNYQNPTLRHNAAFMSAQTYARKGVFITAATAYNQAYDQFQQKSPKFAAQWCLVEKAFCLVEGEKYARAKKVLDHCEKENQKSSLLLGRIYEYQALLYQNQKRKRLDKALWYAHRSLAIRKTIQGEHTPELIRAYLRVAYVLAKKQRYLEALEKLAKATTLLKVHSSPYLEGLRYHIKGLCIANRSEKLNKGVEKGHKTNRWLAKEIYKKALQKYQQALAPSHPKIGIIWANIGTAWQMMHQYAMDGLRKKNASTEQLDAYYKKYEPLLDSGLVALTKGIQVLEMNPLENRRMLSYFYWYKGLSLDMKKGDHHREVLRLYQRSLMSFIPGFFSSDIFAFPNFSVLRYNEEVREQMIEVLTYKARLLMAYAQKLPQLRRKYLALSWQCHQVIEKLLYRVSIFTVLERDQIELNVLIANHTSHYVSCFALYRKLLSPKEQQKLGVQLLSDVERHKKEALWRGLHNLDIKKKAKVATKDILEETQLRSKAQYFARQVALTKPGTLPRIQAMDSVSEYRTRLINQEEYILHNNKLYKDLLRQSSSISITEIQQYMPNHQAVIAYAPSFMIAFVITKKRFWIKRMAPKGEQGEVFGNKVQRTYQGFQKMMVETSKGKEALDRKWVQASHQLYQHMFKPLEDCFSDSIQSLLISNVHLYESVPMGAMLQHYNPEKSLKVNIRESALINRFAIAYTPSLGILLSQTRKHKTRQKQNYEYQAQFVAPIHFGKSKKAAKTRGQLLAIQKLRAFTNVAELDSLPHSAIEVDACQKILLQKYKTPNQVKTWTGSQATEERMRTILGESNNILHLATHAVSSLRSFELGRMFFYPEVNHSDAQDGITYYGDLVTMRQPPARLVVLSACETGLGIQSGGEGALSLHRAFLQSGVQKVLHTQWAVYDEATTYLMIQFYTHLAQGKNETQALRLAKIHMMTLALGPEYDRYSTCPPVYWAAFKLTQQTFD